MRPSHGRVPGLTEPVRAGPRSIRMPPNDPRECRRHANNCRRLARIAPTSLVAAQYLRLATRWLCKADGLEESDALVAAFRKAEAA